MPSTTAGVQNKINDSPPNSLRAFAAGAFENAWQQQYALLNSLKTGPLLVEAQFYDILNKPQTYLAEIAFDAVGISLNLHDGMIQSVLSHYRNLHRQGQAASSSLYGTVGSAISAPSAGDEGFGLQGWQFWGGYTGSSSNLKSHGGYAGFDSHSNGFYLGASRELS